LAALLLADQLSALMLLLSLFLWQPLLLPLLTEVA
jgi:hypothetical protein